MQQRTMTEYCYSITPMGHPLKKSAVSPASIQFSRDCLEPRLATVDDEFCAGDEGTVATRQEQRGAGNLLGLTKTLQGRLGLGGFHHGLQVLRAQAQLAGERRADGAGTRRVDPDATWYQLGAERPRERAHRRLGGGEDEQDVPTASGRQLRVADGIGGRPGASLENDGWYPRRSNPGARWNQSGRTT